jgi:hypothetical protein
MESVFLYAAIAAGSNKPALPIEAEGFSRKEYHEPYLQNLFFSIMGEKYLRRNMAKTHPIERRCDMMRLLSKNLSSLFLNSIISFEFCLKNLGFISHEQLEIYWCPLSKIEWPTLVQIRVDATHLI